MVIYDWLSFTMRCLAPWMEITGAIWPGNTSVASLATTEVTRSSQGVSCQVGSPKSKVLVRIYDKAAERGFDDGRHWVRVELQMRDGQTEEFSRIPMDIGEAFAGVLLNCLRFVEPAPSDSNKFRWQMVDYWANFVGDVGRIKIFTLPDSDYNLEKFRRVTIGDFVSTGTYNPPSNPYDSNKVLALPDILTANPSMSNTLFPSPAPASAVSIPLIPLKAFCTSLFTGTIPLLSPSCMTE